MNQSEYISHNLNAHDDIKIIALMESHGATGYGVYWVLVEVMGKEEDYRLPNKPFTARAIARKCNETIDKVQQVINSCINELELFEVEEEFFFSQSLRDRMKIREEKYEKKRLAGKEGANKRWQKNGTAIGADSNGMANDGTECQIESEIERESEIEIKGEGSNARAHEEEKKESNQDQTAFRFKPPPKNSNSKKGAGAKKTTAHLFSDSPYYELEAFKQAPAFCKPEFEINYPNINLEYYHKQLLRYCSGETPKRKSDWIHYVEGWMSEDKSKNKLVTVHGTENTTTPNQRNRTALTTSVGGSHRPLKRSVL